MAANGHKPRRARIWPALLLIAVLLAACIGAVRWGLGDLVQPAPPAETGENQRPVRWRKTTANGICGW